MILKIKGGKPLTGEVVLKGAKNSVTKLMVASMLSEGPSTIFSVPNIQDVEVVTQMITLVGGEVKKNGEDGLTINTKNMHLVEPEKIRSINKKSRIPILFAGPLLSRFGEVFVPELGGCEIGPRPVNFHLDALQKMGAEVHTVEHGYHLRAARLRGAKLSLPFPSVGTTEQVLLAAVLADGITELSNAAIEPEIIDLICALQKMGADISMGGDRTILITGVERLQGFSHTAIPDRLEAASWACAAAVSGGQIFVRGARQIDLMQFLNKFRQAGGVFEVQSDGIMFTRGPQLKSVVLETDVYPGFATDWQQPFVTLLTQAEGTSVVHETVYENRFEYTKSLNAMGARIQLRKECMGGLPCRFGQLNHYHSATILGPTPLAGAHITVPDLRAGFAYVIAALSAQGETVIENAELLNRGYEDFFGKLSRLHADISISEESR